MSVTPESHPASDQSDADQHDAKKAEEQKAKTVQHQHQHEGPETRNTENRGKTSGNRGK